MQGLQPPTLGCGSAPVCWPCGDDWTVGQVDFERVWSNNGNKKSVMVAFQFKWHDVKDVPNNLLKHITLENNDKN